MVLPICVEVFIRFIFTILKFMLSHWFLMLWVLIIAWIMSRNVHVYAWILAGMDALMDSSIFVVGIFGLLGALFKTVTTGKLFSLYTVTIAGQLTLAQLIAVGFGILWMVGVIISDANPVLKYLSAPIYFGVGVLIAVLPGTFLANLIFGYGLRNRIAANVICGLPIFLFLIFGFVFNFMGVDIMCDLANYGLSFFN